MEKTFGSAVLLFKWYVLTAPFTKPLTHTSAHGWRTKNHAGLLIGSSRGGGFSVMLRDTFDTKPG